MSKKTVVDDKHFRIISDDGKKSTLYEKTGGFASMDVPVEKEEHHSDGITDAYEADNSITGGLFFGGKGKKKND